MLPLRAVLGQWAPRASRGLRPGSDPLLELSSAWDAIVGDDVARNSYPGRLIGRTLTVVTGSSAWSQQLSLLSEQLLAAIRARLGAGTPVDSLRFRVGTIVAPAQRRAGRATPARTPRSLPGMPALPDAGEPADAAEAVARFRSSVEARQRAKREQGWKECRRCGVLLEAERAPQCATCGNAIRADREAATARLLFEAPWLGFAGTTELIRGLTHEEYERIRTALLARWWRMLERAKTEKRLSRDRRERLVASSYVLLQSGVPPEEILPATVRNVLGDELHDLIYETDTQTKTHVE